MVSSRNVAAESKKRCSKRKDASASLTSASAASVTKGFQIEESISTKFPLRPDVSAVLVIVFVIVIVIEESISTMFPLRPDVRAWK